MPRRRGGEIVTGAFEQLCGAIERDFQRHDRIIRAIAAHYHLGAMHPFGDGNGRTARATEAFMLRAAGVNDMVMVSLSNYYYEHQEDYRTALYESRTRGHDLTPILTFALRAISERCNALASDIADQSKRVLFREFARSLYSRLRSPRKRVLVERQLHILNVLLDSGGMEFKDLFRQIEHNYLHLQYGFRARIRDIFDLVRMDAVRLNEGRLEVNLDWPQQTSETELVARFENLPRATSSANPTMAELTRLLGRRW